MVHYKMEMDSPVHNSVLCRIKSKNFRDHYDNFSWLHGFMKTVKIIIEDSMKLL